MTYEVTITPHRHGGFRWDWAVSLDGRTVANSFTDTRLGARLAVRKAIAVHRRGAIKYEVRK